VTGVANGICIIAGNQAGNSVYDAAPQATLDVLIGNKVNQTITFGPAPTIPVTGNRRVSATASSGLPVTFRSNTPSTCTILGDAVSASNVGTCTIAADQAGNNQYNAAPQATQDITVTSAAAYANLRVEQSLVTNVGTSGKDIMFAVIVTNGGSAASGSVTLKDTMQPGMGFVWASSSSCGFASGTVTCNLGTLVPGSSARLKIVVRPAEAGSFTHTLSVSGSTEETDYTNNSTSSNVMRVNWSAAATQVLRYRLYSDGTKEHLFTTDLNEYNVLGANGWSQEGTVGKVLNNPGSFNGVQATPYYRLYNTSSTWHHWTTDANEYYTLIQFTNWNGEGVDGYILPTLTAGATQLYRLLYPFVPGLHHWTIDANEYNTLISQYGWTGEGGAGFVIQ
jgi:uncharacterized repeat protein (TIGR01451 family)